MDIVNLNFKICFEPKDKSKFGGRRRFAVGAKSLHYYVGFENAKTATDKALKSTKDIFTIKFREHGKLDFYAK